MKIKLEVSQKNYEKIEQELISHGFTIDDDAELVLSERNQYLDYISCRKETISCHISVSEVIYIESFGHAIIIHTASDDYKCSDRLWQLEKALNPKKFLRISNSVIIAKDKVKHIRSALSQKFILTLSNGSTVDVARTYYYIFKNAFGL